MLTVNPSWYCARTKAKHDHIAAANVRRNLGLEVFHPQLRTEKPTRRGLVHTVEPLFPGYIFVRCLIEEKLNDIRYANGVSTVLNFGGRIPVIPDSVIGELQACFEAQQPLVVEAGLVRGTEVVVAEGAFSGLRAQVLRVMPARQRVQVLLDILGRPTTVEVDRNSLARGEKTMADLVPILAAQQHQCLRTHVETPGSNGSSGDVSGAA